MATADNISIQVATYNDSNLAHLVNSFAFLNLSNRRFENFENIEKNLGSSVTYDLPPRFTTTGSLVASFQAAEQRERTLTVDQQESVAYEFSAQQFIFQVRDYMEKFGKSAMMELGTKVESNVAKVAEENTFKFYGSPAAPITTFGQLDLAIEYHRLFGAANNNYCMILDNLTFSRVVNSGLGQFTLDRNNRMANSWEIGEFGNCKFYKSNLLPIHTAGTEGQQGSTLTVVSTTKNADGGITSITFSGTNAASDADSVKQYDKFVFSDGVAGQPNLRFRTFIGHEVSQHPVQFAASADAASTAGSQVTVSLTYPLYPTSGRNQNINVDIVAGMQATVLDTHRCGLLMSGDPLFLAMPRLPATTPFPSARSTDPLSGCSMRTYYGEQFGQNARGMVHDVIWGKDLVPEYATMIALPA